MANQECQNNLNRLFTINYSTYNVGIMKITNSTREGLMLSYFLTHYVTAFELDEKNKGDGSFLKNEYISEITGMSIKEVKKAKTSLRKCGLITYRRTLEEFISKIYVEVDYEKLEQLMIKEACK